MASLWKHTNELKHFDRLDGNIKTDVLIIGGGICGLLTAYYLKKVGMKCIIAEADRICGKTTSNTTAKITAQHGFIYKKITDKYGSDAAKLYYKANDWAITQFGLLGTEIEKRDSYVYSLNDPNELEKEYNAAILAGAAAELVKNTDLPFETAGAVCFRNQAQFNPLDAVSKIIHGLDIYEHTRITELSPHLAKYDRGNIYADAIVVATHFPMLNKHGAYFLKMYQHRSYVLGLENIKKPDGMYVDGSGQGLSFRDYKDLLLLGGGSHKTGKKGGGIDELKARIKYAWAAQDCMSLDSMPYIGRYAKNTDSLYVATGFNKWGMTSSMTAAHILKDMITNKKNEYEELFSPQRGMLCAQLFKNCTQAAVNLMTPTVPRCPHLGCALKYNREEKSWDCPCHGSRFSKNGELIEGPANRGFKDHTKNSDTAGRV